MDFKFKGKKYSLPVTLNQITVRQKIEFDRLYRDQINEMYANTFKLDDQGELEEMDEIEASLFKVNVAVMNISFFTGIPLQEVENEMSVDDVMNLYYSCIHQMYEEQENIELQETYVFNDQLWYIEPPYLTNESKTTFNQLVTSKQVIKQMQELSAGKYEAIPYLAAIYLRKEDEEFQEEWLNSGAERLEMMYDLPMDIANAIAFFAEFNGFVSENFSVFSGGGPTGDGPNLASQFEKWGWIPFLNYVAKEAVIFYKNNGKSNLDNVKETKAYDVLIWASVQADEAAIMQEYYNSLKTT